MRLAHIVALMIVLGATSTETRAQDAAPTAPVPTVPDQAAGPDRARAKELLERRRALAETALARIDEAIAKLDRGEAVDPALVEGRGPFAGQGDDFPDGQRGPRAGRADPRDEGAAPRMGPGDPGQPPSIEETRRLRVFIDEHLPLLAARLRDVEKHDPQAASRMIGRIAPRLREAFEARERSPEVFGLRIEELEQGFELLDAARRTRRILDTEGADSQAAADATARFRELTAAHFDTQVKLQRAEVADLEARVAELRLEIDRKTTHRDAEIDQRVAEVLRNTRPERPQGAGRPPRQGTDPGRGRRGPE